MWGLSAPPEAGLALEFVILASESANASRIDLVDWVVGRSDSTNSNHPEPLRLGRLENRDDGKTEDWEVGKLLGDWNNWKTEGLGSWKDGKMG